MSRPKRPKAWHPTYGQPTGDPWGGPPALGQDEAQYRAIEREGRKLVIRFILFIVLLVAIMALTFFDPRRWAQ